MAACRASKVFRAVLAILLLVVVLVLCLVVAAGRPPPTGGAPPARPRRGPDPARSPHLVVDTLNLVHWRAGQDGDQRAAITPERIVETIDATAPTLKLRHVGRVVYVLKDRESRFNDDAARDAYRQAAIRNGVTICIAERYEDPPAGAKAGSEHSSRGRDDFYTCLLAQRYRCAVLTEDRLRDFSSFRGTVPPFHVVEYSYWRDLPQRDYIRPDAATFQRLRRPRTVRPSEYF